LYTLRETRTLSDGLGLGYLTVDSAEAETAGAAVLGLALA
jgi:hypothetical protein